eukprot:gene19011-22757_t
MEDPSKSMFLDKDRYDVCILGTGFVESLLAGALARVGKTVIHLDRNAYYGAYDNSFTLNQLNDILEKGEVTHSAAIPTNLNNTPNQQVISHNAPPPLFRNSKVYKYTPPPPPPVVEEPVIVVATPPVVETQVEIPAAIVVEEETPTSEAVVVAEGSEEKKEEVAVVVEEVQPVMPAMPKKRPVDTSLFGQGRQFIIDLCPSLLYSKGALVNLLISSATSKYLEFKSLDQNFLFFNDQLYRIPSTKGSIFKDSTFSLRDKRSIMKFIESVREVLDGEAPEDKKDGDRVTFDTIKSKHATFAEYVKSFKMSAQVEAFILYGLSLIHEAVESVTVEDGIRSVGLYISSLLVYGTSPFLVPYYGYGDIPQAFCRLCAVFGGTYVLDRAAHSLIIDPATNKYSGIVCTEGQTIHSQYFITSPKCIKSMLANNSEYSTKE